MILKGKVAIITGAAQGIGKAIALKFAHEGADIVVSDINIDLARATAQEIEQLGRKSLALKVDVSKTDEAEEMVEDALKAFGHIDILVNNAGITRDTLLMRMKKDDWDLVLNINLGGTFNCAKAVVKHMVKARAGKIINISSVVGLMGNAGQINYASSKAGVIGFTKSLARELASRGINVNAVAPGFIDTDMTRVLPEKERQLLVNQIPLSRLGLPEDVANCVKFLASDEASYITGQVIQVNGGMYM
ncbi:MAG: 3-oxoacyl-[acyl-carrier-protein] reductase [Candidatus Tectomicrobia bacterium]|uniref:3-oxoacyl-[acyl-carrier-protein] reductase n=1 Tax=Tectimicrobiota bacterium TaxID=2528274 RepID=A0A933GPC5_UNCTE|nr:3-oxoacyl-[acyl-carrier-protein] reductase [Candidatus Tectomicrobia bacterium]